MMQLKSINEEEVGREKSRLVARVVQKFDPKYLDEFDELPRLVFYDF